MTTDKDFADSGRDHVTTESRHTHRVSDRRRWIGVLKHRWPAALGVVIAALTAFDLKINVELVSSLSTLAAAMALVYVGSAALDSRRFAWVVFVAAFAILALTVSLDWKINLPVIFVVAALAFFALGAVRGRLREPGGLPLQSAGMLAFGATALAAFNADPTLGGYLVAFALLGHAAWDAVHFAQNRVVARSYAEMCAVIDLVVGAAVLFVLFTG